MAPIPGSQLYRPAVLVLSASSPPVHLLGATWAPMEGSGRISTPDEGLKGSGASVQGSACGITFDLLSSITQCALMYYFNWTSLRRYEPQFINLSGIIYSHLGRRRGSCSTLGHRITWAWCFPAECNRGESCSLLWFGWWWQNRAAQWNPCRSWAAKLLCLICRQMKRDLALPLSAGKGKGETSSCGFPCMMNVVFLTFLKPPWGQGKISLNHPPAWITVLYLQNLKAKYKSTNSCHGD